MTHIPRFFRVFLRVLKLILVIASADLSFFLTIKLLGRSGSIKARARWMQRQAQRFLWALGIKPVYSGDFPKEGVLISNHVSYIDILLHAAREPIVFISKADVAQWPVFGSLSRWAGTLFIRRERKSDVVRITSEMPVVVKAGVVLAFFPEGTSSSGKFVRSFRAPLLEPLAANGWTVTPAFLRYGLEPGDGVVEDEIAWYRPETLFAPHFINMLGKRRIHATVTYGNPQPSGADRKELAARLREQVCALGSVPLEAVALEEV